MSTEIPIWVNGKIRWLSGIDKKTTCKDVIEVLLEGEDMEAKDFAIMERWRKVERPLDGNSKILKIWSHWGNEKKEVRLCLRRIDNEIDSGRGSPIGGGNTPSLRRKRNRARGNGKPPWAHPETLHPKRLVELGNFSKKEYDEFLHLKMKENGSAKDCGRLNDTYILNNKPYNYDNYQDIYEATYENENVNNRKKSIDKSYHCSGTGRLHSTPLSNSENTTKKPSKCCSKRGSKQKVRNSENIEKLMKLILAQGATIQSQLQKLKEREEQIELLEHERHRERLEKNGRNYLLETYLGSLKDAEIPSNDDDDKKENDVRTDLKEDKDDELSENKDLERLLQNETEFNLDTPNRIYGRSQMRPRCCGRDAGNQSSAQHSSLKTYQKSKRSKSESRNQECKLEGTLKRTLSNNDIAETCGSTTVENNEPTHNADTEESQNTKVESEEVELKRIQSQTEMWEKVFKINKILEKEEENLVRLHIKIKKFQSESYRLAKEKFEINAKCNGEGVLSKSDVEVVPETKTDAEEILLEDCAEIQRKLEILRTDLEQNSKEIYQNFTKLIEDDEIVKRKRSCLTKLLSDLEITNHENDMLNEMLAMRDQRNLNGGQSCNTYLDESTNSVKNENCNDLARVSEMNTGTFNPSIEAQSEADNKKISLPASESSNQTNEITNQRSESEVEQEKLQPTKPKIVKISFEDQIQNSNNLESSREKVFKEPPSVSVGALKSILKNKKYGCHDSSEKSCLSNQPPQHAQEFSRDFEFNNDKLMQSSNLNVNNSYEQNEHSYSSDSNRINSNYPNPLPFPFYKNCLNDPNQHFFSQPPLTKLSEDFKTAHPVRTSYPRGICKTQTNVFPHSTMITTKALVHNDTDSSTSSDTSGMSSMYSSSPTVEESYPEQNYVLDTLV